MNLNKQVFFTLITGALYIDSDILERKLFSDWVLGISLVLGQLVKAMTLI